jgi:predicted Zn-dependent protease with MMP-like domain
MTYTEFEALVTEALDNLPQKFKNVLSNVEVVIEDEPTDFQRRKMHLRPWTRLFGLYEGVPQTNRGNYNLVLPYKISIFKNTIEESYVDDEGIKEQVRRTVLHEIGHHLGMDDKQLRKLKY